MEIQANKKSMSGNRSFEGRSVCVEAFGPKVDQLFKAVKQLVV